MRVPIVSILFTIALAFAVLSGVACAAPQAKKTPPKKASPQASADPLAKAMLGTWTTTIPHPQGGTPGRLTVTFKADGTQTQIAEGNGRRINILAKYSVSKGVLTQTLVRAEQYGKPIPSLSTGTKKLKVRMEGDTLYFAAPAQGGTEMPFKRVKK